MKQNQPSPTHLKARNHVSCLMPQTLSLLWKGISSLVSALVALFSITRSQTPYHALGMITILCVLVNIDHLDQLNAATSTPPNRMAFQSYLTDTNGDPIAAGKQANKTINFTIYGSESDADAKWKEQQVVTVNDGHFSVILGEGERLPDPSGKMLAFKDVFTGTGASDRFIELTIVNTSAVGSDQTLLPRLRLLPSPYAFMASKVASLDLSDTAVIEGQLGKGYLVDDSITTVQIENETIQSADIKDGAVTSSDIASNTIASANIKDGSIASIDIANSTIVSADIKDGAVTSSDVASNTIVSSNIKDGSITSADIANKTIRSADIADANIGRTQLGGGTFISPNNAQLRIVRGHMTESAGIREGRGWTVKRLSTGRYRITFSPSFKAGTLPVITVSGYNQDWDDNVISLYDGSNTGVSVISVDATNSNESVENSGIMFIAIGE